MYLKDASLLNFENGFCCQISICTYNTSEKANLFLSHITIHTQSLPVKYESFQHNGY